MIRCLTSFGRLTDVRRFSGQEITDVLQDIVDLEGVRLRPNVCKRSSNGRFG
jgi:hypothetical protein